MSVVHLGSLRLEHGDVLPNAHLGFWFGGKRGAPVIVALGGISAGREPGWWSQIGPDRAIDPREVGVLGIDWLGGAGASRGPLPGEEFPAVTPRDQAVALLAVLDALRIDAVTVVGCSYGGMVGLALAELAPHRVDHLVAIGAAHRPHPHATANRSVQRRILDLAARTGSPEDGVALARALAMTTYQDAEAWDARFAGRPVPDPLGARAPIDAWLEDRGALLAASMSPETYRALTASIDLHRVEPEAIHAPVTVVGLEPDALAPAWLLDELAARLPRLVARHRIATKHGHDGFLKEERAVTAVLRSALCEVSP